MDSGESLGLAVQPARNPVSKQGEWNTWEMKPEVFSGLPHTCANVQDTHLCVYPNTPNMNGHPQKWDTESQRIRPNCSDLLRRLKRGVSVYQSPSFSSTHTMGHGISWDSSQSESAGWRRRKRRRRKKIKRRNRKRKRKKKGFSTAEAQDSESGHLSFATETRHFVL